MKKNYEKPKITVTDVETESLLVISCEGDDFVWGAKKGEYSDEWEDEESEQSDEYEEYAEWDNY